MAMPIEYYGRFYTFTERELDYIGWKNQKEEVKMRESKVGDWVTIRSWESMEKEFKTNSAGNINVPYFFTTEMKSLCGKKFRIKSIAGAIFGLDGTKSIFSREMFEENYKYNDTFSVGFLPKIKSLDNSNIYPLKEKTDMKEALGGLKPPLAQISPAFLNYTARALQYGSDKYEIGNYLRPAPDGNDINRLLDYISATQRHLAQWADSIVRHLGFRTLSFAHFGDDTAVFAKDEGSNLPHAAHAVASLSIALQQAVDAGLLPLDPGTPWKETK